MKITEIKAERGHLFKVTFEGGKSVLLDKEFCLEVGIRQDAEISNNDLKTFLKESDYRRALSRAVWYVEQGHISSKKLREKLSRGDFSRQSIEKTVARMIELGLINDEKYAEYLAENYLSKCVSHREAEQKIIGRGIDRETAKAALELFEVDAREQIKALIHKNYRTKLETEDGIKKVFAALLRKGFNYGDVKYVLAQYSDELKYSGE